MSARKKETTKVRKKRVARHRRNSRAYYARRADALVRAALEIAIQRFDLTSEIYDLQNQNEIAAMVLDIQNALRGSGTCAEGPCAEWLAIIP